MRSFTIGKQKREKNMDNTITFFYTNNNTLSYFICIGSIGSSPSVTLNCVMPTLRHNAHKDLCFLCKVDEVALFIETNETNKLEDAIIATHIVEFAPHTSKNIFSKRGGAHKIEKYVLRNCLDAVGITHFTAVSVADKTNLHTFLALMEPHCDKTKRNHIDIGRYYPSPRKGEFCLFYVNPTVDLPGVDDTEKITNYPQFGPLGCGHGGLVRAHKDYGKNLREPYSPTEKNILKRDLYVCLCTCCFIISVFVLYYIFIALS